MSWQCPECKEEISRLNYSVNTSGSEYGSADLNTQKVIRNRITDYDSQDNDNTEWSDTPDYSCPECSDDVDIDDLIWTDEDEEEKPKIKLEEEETHNIITPQNQIIRHDRLTSIDDNMICENCKHIFVTDTEYNDNEESVTCPKCGTENSKEDYKNHIESGFFNQLTIKKHVNKKNPRKLRRIMGKSK